MAVQRNRQSGGKSKKNKKIIRIRVIRVKGASVYESIKAGVSIWTGTYGSERYSNGTVIK